MNMFRKNKKGFTLIELIIVIAILAILAAIAIPMFTGITDSANDAVARANASNIATAYNAYNALNPNAKLDAVPANILANLTEQNLWPAGMDVTVVEQKQLVNDAWTWLNIHDGVCELQTTAVVPASPAFP